MPRWWNDGRLERSGRRKTQGGTGGRKGCGKAGPEEVIWDRRTKTVGRCTPDIHKPLGEREGSVRDVSEESAVVVMPDFSEPPRGNEG